MNDSQVFRLRHGRIPLLVSMPHTGVEIPAALRAAYVARALDLEDTDWHLERLYDFLDDMDVSVLTPTISRYVIDLNRPPDDTPMYPGAANTELCPTRFFSGEPLYAPDAQPDEGERGRRLIVYWQPYHDALEAELQRIRAAHGYALLWDAHSIRSEIPWLFEGHLPDLCIGTADGASAGAVITESISAATRESPQYTAVVNGRFKGGYITRRYGNPAQHIHAVQLEMCQRTYMQEAPPYAYDAQLAANIQPVLRHMMKAAVRASEGLYAK